MSAGPALSVAESLTDAVGLDLKRASRVLIGKAHVIGGEAGGLRTSGLSVETLYGATGAAQRPRIEGFEVVPPPFELQALLAVARHSNTLGGLISSYSTNIEQFGYRLEPVLDPEAADAFDKVRVAIRLERQHERYRQGLMEQLASKKGRPRLDLAAASFDVPEPSRREVKNRLRDLVDQMSLQKFLAQRFFEFCTVGCSFEELRARRRKELEETGNAFWEVSRNGLGEIARISHLPVQTMRVVGEMDDDVTEVESLVPISPIRFERIKLSRAFRRYAQVTVDGSVTGGGGAGLFFKGVGDPRVMSAKTGKRYLTVEELRVAEGADAKEATEVVHFTIFDSGSAYGVPRWIGNLMAILGTQAAEYVNFSYFDNKSVPPLALLVSGGRLSKPSVERIESFVENHLKGRTNFHKILVIEAVPHKSAGTGQEAPIKLTLMPLVMAQMTDGQFLQYARMNRSTTGQSFRLPVVLQGGVDDFRGDAVQVAKEFAEEQIYQPERQAFDAFVNRDFMPEIGAMLWRFTSNAPASRDPMKMATITATMTRAGVLSINEARGLAGDVFNRDFSPRAEKWARQPMAISLAEIGAKNRPLAQDGVGGGESGDQERVPKPEREQRRDGLLDDQASGSGTRDRGNASSQAKAAGGEGLPSLGGLPGLGGEEDDVEVVRVGMEEMRGLFDDEPEDGGDADD